MKWTKLYDKIGKQNLKKMNKLDVIVNINDKEMKVTDIKFKSDGTPYLTVEDKQEELNE